MGGKIKMMHGDELRQIRKARKMTISELAQRTSVGYCHLGNIERGVIDMSESVEKAIKDYFDNGVDQYEISLIPAPKRIKPFTPFMTEQDLLMAKPLLDTNTGDTVGDVIFTRHPMKGTETFTIIKNR